MQTTKRAMRINESVVSAELDNEMVLLNVESGLYFGLDELGTMIWSLILTDTTEADIVERIMAEYEADQLQVEADVRNLVDSLSANGLLLPDVR